MIATKQFKWLSLLLIVSLIMQLFIVSTKAQAAEALAAPSGDALTLVKDKKAEAAIIWWAKDNRSDVPSFAAAELQQYAKKMTGVTIPVRQGVLSGDSLLSSAVIMVTGEEARQLAAGDGLASIPSQWFAAAASMLTNAQEDSFVSLKEGSRLILAGSNDRGTLYAAYDLLERIGVKFFAPNFDYYAGNAEHVPAAGTLAATGLQGVSEPSFKLRRKYVEEGWSHNAENITQLIDWMAKNKLNTLVVPYDYVAIGKTKWDNWREALIPELKKRDMIIEVGGHGFESFLRPDKYRQAHPDWFVANHNVFNIANDEAVNTYVNEVIAYLRERPEIGIFDAWPPDVAQWPAVVLNKFGSSANAYAYVVNKLHQAVKEQLPGVKLEAIAYASHDQPPTSSYMYDETVFIDFAPYFRSYRETVFDPNSGVNKPLINLIKKWKDAYNGNLTMYEYYRRYAFHSLPVVFPQLIGQELPYYEQLGMDGIGTYSEPGDWIPFEITHLILAQLSWNVHLNAQELIQGYIQARYGAASAEMSEYFRLVEEAGRAVFSNPPGDYNNSAGVTKMRNNYLQAKAQISGAQTKVATGSPEAYMLQRLMWNIEFAIADTEGDYYRLQGDNANANVAKLHAQTLLNAHRYDGIMLQNSYSVRRYINGYGNTDWMYDANRGEMKYAPMVTTMGTYQNNSIKHIVDGDEGTVYWSNLNPGIGDYVGVDLRKVQKIKEIKLLMATSAKPNDYIRNGVVEVSKDFKEWHTVAQVSNQAEVRVTAEPDTEARFIRIRSTAAQTQWVIIREFGVEAEELQEPTRTTLEVEANSVKVGDLASVDLGLSGIPNQVYGLDISLEYDPSSFEFVAAESAKEGLTIIQTKQSEGTVRIIAASEGASHPITGQTAVAALTFRALGASPGAEIATTAALLGDEFGLETNAASAAVLIEVTDRHQGVPGDANNDGKVTIGDLGMVAAHYGKDASSPDWLQIKHLDLSGNGSIDIADLAFVARKVVEQ